MLHQTPQTTSTRPVPQEWRDTLAIGDIIRWPLNDDPEAIALIIEIESIVGWRVLTIAPGIAEHGQPVRPGTLRLSRNEVRKSGLAAPVRFELDRRLSVAPTHPALAATEDSPVVGRLSESPLERLHAQRARLHALRDIAAARRQERRTAPRGDRRTGWRVMPRAARPQTAQEGRQ